MDTKTYVANIQKFCVHDGPGIRTVAFLMGCPLRCKWCQNPENLNAHPVVMFDAGKCVGCADCVKACVHGCNSLAEEGIRIQRQLCISCGACAEACLTEARSLCGEEKTVEELYHEIMKDEVFFRNSGGGVTLSGGEPALHPKFVSELFNKFKLAGIHTAIETSGSVPNENMRRIAGETELFLYDYKIDTRELHIRWTKRDNDVIKENLEYLVRNNKRIIIRIPLIPGVNDGEEFEKIIRYLSRFPMLRQIHLLPFHQVGSSKYALTGTSYEMEHVDECLSENAAACALIARERGFDVNIGGWDTD